ncbi:MAG: WD40 repeat domain-containing protein [Gemmataceae bacterium]
MKYAFPSLLLTLLLGWPAFSDAQEPVAPPGDKEPVLRLEAGGPTSYVTALAFSPDGRRLYAAGFDKVVRVWELNDQGRFVLNETAYRVPIGPGLNGALNALALSDDERWLAVGGLGVVRGGAGFRQPGLIIPAIGGMTPAMREDEGTIYVFDLKMGTIKLFRGHTGPVLALAFAPAHPHKPPLLVSAAREWNEAKKTYQAAARLWDVDNAKTLAQRADLSKNDELRPSLSAWHGGQALLQVRVAIAWQDGTFRLWDAEPDKGGLWTSADGQYNNTTAYLPSQDRIYTTSFQGFEGQLQARHYTQDNGPPRDPQRRAVFPPQNQVGFFPRALTLLSSRAGGPLDLAAVILRAPARDEEHILTILDLNGQGANFGAVKARMSLWQGSASALSLAAAPGGRHLAVAGDNDHQILVFAVADLLNNLKRPQILHSVGTTFRHVSFVTKDKQTGLLLNEAAEKSSAKPRPPRTGDLIFDFGQRLFTTELQGWSSTAPDMTGWRVQVSPARKNDKGQVLQWAIAVTGSNQGECRITLKPGESVTALALLPTNDKRPTPILALAYLDRYRQPWLVLFNARTAAKVRQLTGHVATIRSLALSGDGHLLASVADDQTISVWSLTDLDKVLDQRGLLEGVAVQDVGGNVRVVEIEDDSPAQGRLAVNALVTGWVHEGKLSPFASARDFYDAISLFRPGQRVMLRVRSAAGQPHQDIELPISQGIDERKPLLSLFVTRAADEKRGWIGWNPNGPYDVSDPQAETYLGWHFNTGQIKEPARFALADQYRKEYLKKDILKYLVARGDLGAALEDWEQGQALPPPRMGLGIDELGPDAATVRGRLLARQMPLTLRMTLENDFPPEKIASARWQFDDQPWRDLDLEAGIDRTADLSQLDWQRGPHLLRVEVKTQETRPQVVVQELPVQYQPPPPVIAFDPAWLQKYAGDKPLQRLEVRDEARFPIIAMARPGRPGESLHVTLRHGDAPAQEVGANIREEITLRPGDNLITIQARHRDALAGYEDLETTTQSFLVTFQPPRMVLPPRITLETVTPDGANPMTVELGRPVIVSSAVIRLQGRIHAEENLHQAQFGDQPLAGFQADNAKTFPIDMKITLKPGRQTFTFSANTKTSPRGQANVIVEYRPPLPQLVITTPAPGTVVHDNGKDDGNLIQLQGRLLPLADPHPYRAAIWVNDRLMDEAPRIDSERQIVAAAVRLQPGVNRVQVRLSNEWHAAATFETQVSYRRPPRIVSMRHSPVGDTPLVDVVAHVETPADLPLTQAVLNSRQLPATAMQVEEKRPTTTLWKVSAAQVPLEQGDNVLRLLVSNADGPSSQPETLAVRYLPPPPPKAAVQFLDPQRDVNVDTPTYLVRFRVTSESRLRHVELLRGGERLHTASVEDVTKNQMGHYEVEGSVTVSLQVGANTLRLEALNDGGARATAATISYAPPPVRLVIDRLESLDPKGGTYQPRQNPDGRFIFPQVADGRLKLHGRVIWSDDTARREAAVNWVHVWINGFKQLPAPLPLTSIGQPERPFVVDIRLNRRHNNVIEINLPELKLQAGPRSQCEVLLCENPVQGQRLHLFIVGIGNSDGATLTKQALNALQAQPLAAKPGVYTASPTFSEIHLHGPLVGANATTGKINSHLIAIQRAIRQNFTPDSKDTLNDVVMLYYQGQERITPTGHYFLTSESVYDPQLRWSVISCQRLQNLFADTPGAKVLLLDVVRGTEKRLAQAPDQLHQWPQNAPAAVLRYAWEDPQQIPANIHLLDTLSDLLPRSPTLSGLAVALQGTASQIAQRYPLDYWINVPDVMKGIVVGKES